MPAKVSNPLKLLYDTNKKARVLYLAFIIRV